MSDLGMPAKGHSPYVPMLIALVALLLYFAFQTLELVETRSQLAQLRTGQTAALTDGAKIHAQFDSLAGGTAVLAQQGNAEAKTIVAEFSRRGFTFRPAGQR
jgi:hypothetical protein